MQFRFIVKENTPSEPGKSKVTLLPWPGEASVAGEVSLFLPTEEAALLPQYSNPDAGPDYSKENAKDNRIHIVYNITIETA